VNSTFRARHVPNIYLEEYASACSLVSPLDAYAEDKEDLR